MNIWVYAIAKDEARFAERWVQSMGEADGIAVLDTGSSDDTAEILSRELEKRNIAHVIQRQEISPWRFDTARNESMKLLPPEAELLVCTDLDELLCPGWRKALESAWQDGCTTGQYEYVWSFNPDGSDGVKFLYEKIHIPSVARWEHPVHETLSYGVPKRMCFIPGMRLEHHPDSAKSRASYLALLEMSVAEDPENDRNMHYLGREYMFRGRWQEAIETLKRHLALKSAVWDAERGASMRYIACCYAALGDEQARELWLLRSAVEAPGQRESWLALGRLYYEKQQWRPCVRSLSRCLDIKKRDMSYITTPEAWGPEPWDLISLAWWQLGEKGYAAACAREALRYGENDRIANNLAFFGG